ncbi:Potassium sodium hyperpolarization-activated cyclic nucleotide-gated channel-like protein [Schistosoma japonicum]|uniref:Potassium sodium hyperpolarization-activated cyclic nucleotide-gated channel-like protein n=1 Tax=Schistosoma japonicum TaxID=6182 RepID=A0A4Z2D0U7_SCHJA|nr:Potassium sodium hyperpolarization-activated cyclic nucleotide-gated channel-like protein [Schistosoma japonicum]
MWLDSLVNYLKHRKSSSHWNTLILRKTSIPEWWNHSTMNRSSTSNLLNTGLLKWCHIKQRKLPISKQCNKTKSEDNLNVCKISLNHSNNWQQIKSSPVNMIVSVVNEYDDTSLKQLTTTNVSMKNNQQANEDIIDNEENLIMAAVRIKLLTSSIKLKAKTNMDIMSTFLRIKLR